MLTPLTLSLLNIRYSYSLHETFIAEKIVVNNCSNKNARIYVVYNRNFDFKLFYQNYVWYLLMNIVVEMKMYLNINIKPKFPKYNEVEQQPQKTHKNKTNKQIQNRKSPCIDQIIIDLILQIYCWLWMTAISLFSQQSVTLVLTRDKKFRSPV